MTKVRAVPKKIPNDCSHDLISPDGSLFGEAIDIKSGGWDYDRIYLDQQGKEAKRKFVGHYDRLSDITEAATQEYNHDQ